MFSSSLMSKLVDAGMTHQVGPCIHTVVVCVVRGKRGGPCTTWVFKDVFHSLMPILVEADLITKWLVYSARRNVLHRATKYVKYAKIGVVHRLIKGKPL